MRVTSGLRMPSEDGVHAHTDAQVRGDAGEFRAVGERRSGDLVGGERRQAQGQQLVVAAEVLVLDARQVAGPLPVPLPEVRAHGGVHASDAGVAECLDGGVGVFAGAGVVGEVEHGGDAAVDRGEGGQPGAGVHVLGSVDRGVAGQGGHDVAAEVVDVRHDPAQLGFPGVPVGVDEAGAEDRAGGIDDHGVARAEVGADGGDGVALDEEVAAVDDAEAGVHGDDGRAGEEDAPFVCGAAPELFEDGGAGGVVGVHEGSSFRTGTGRPQAARKGRGQGRP